MEEDAQNNASDASWLPHFGQTRDGVATGSGGVNSTFAPQVVQNFASGGSGAPQDAQQQPVE